MLTRSDMSAHLEVTLYSPQATAGRPQFDRADPMPHTYGYFVPTTLATPILLTRQSQEKPVPTVGNVTAFYRPRDEEEWKVVNVTTMSTTRAQIDQTATLNELAEVYIESRDGPDGNFSEHEGAETTASFGFAAGASVVVFDAIVAVVEFRLRAVVSVRGLDLDAHQKQLRMHRCTQRQCEPRHSFETVDNSRKEKHTSDEAVDFKAGDYGNART
ncbi:hypothetical protein BDY21DRAFT_419151 [Lineolata rhizophorae]|uniref:Uncharacterized protein n=1 Tax=Lineolata rhizophorae TaxID=578093 RepID=A0A6A6P8V9_9PEZI|nr:hypothetical protein BDY21DRAFT_419151 [Lineolata rhizophorae]